jgi:hypothetical protein
LIKQKSKSPSAASLGKPAQLEKPYTLFGILLLWRFLLTDSSIEIASADKESASQ